MEGHTHRIIYIKRRDVYKKTKIQKEIQMVECTQSNICIVKTYIQSDYRESMQMMKDDIN